MQNWVKRDTQADPYQCQTLVNPFLFPHWQQLVHGMQWGCQKIADCRLSMCTSHCCDNDCKIPSSCVIVVTYSLTTWSSVALKWTLGDDVRISLISVKLLTLSCRRSKTKSLNSSLAPSISLPRLQKWPKLTKETLPSPNYFSHFSVWTHVAIKLGIIISKARID